MLSFKELARKNLSEKMQGYRLLGSIAISSTKRYFNLSEDQNKIQDEILTGYLRFSTLFIKTKDQSLKIHIFKEKEKLMTFLNEEFKKLGYKQRISQIRIKA